MHFDDLLVLVALAGAFSPKDTVARAFLVAAAFIGTCLSEVFAAQLLFVHRPLITSDPHLQNSAKYITPLSISIT
jgi:hypothetical protein